MPKPALSVIIPARNRRELLAVTLDALDRLHCPGDEMEVLVVDDGSTDQTAEMVAGRTSSYRLRLLRNSQAQGPAAARNRGAREAAADILGFLDSDVSVQPGWWDAAKIHFQDPGVGGVEGATGWPVPSPVPTPFTHAVSNTTGGRYLTCNIFYRRAAFEQAGGFDERFVHANREDTDLAFSVMERGWRIPFALDCRVEHPLLWAGRGVYFKEARYGVHEPLLRRKHPQYYRRHLKWIDGRAFPVFYWGVFLGTACMLAAGLLRSGILAQFGAASFILGWAGSVYAVCRKRQAGFGDVALLGLQFLLIPWLRLVWVLRGEWRWRAIVPGPRQEDGGERR